MNIYELIRGRHHYVMEDRVRLFMYQLLKAMDHMHRWAVGGRRGAAGGAALAARGTAAGGVGGRCCSR
jgi:hypothetical protein